MALDADRLRVLVEVAHAGSIAAAAARLGFTPSAVSQQLAKLEREVGAPLVERGRAGTRLTGPGRVLLEHGERVLGELRAAEQAVRAAAGAGPQRIAVGAFSTAARTLLPRALAALKRERPGIRISLVDIEPPDGYGLVAARELDLLLTHRYPGVSLPPARGLRRRLLLRDPLRLVLPRDHRLASAPEIALADLADEDWVSGAPGMPNRICLESLGPLHVAYETRDYEVTLALVAAGLGVSFVPASLVVGHPGVVLRDLRGRSPVREVHVVHPPRPSAPAVELLERLRPEEVR
ncbi:MAG TPA: LysR family transcriptional regulator [Pseudonocardia sp.]|jgi:molybdate transport repressor ModE-like protein|uniref:LysR family transcriptional regulator n=1 Tax=Pseudonocardia sp. TaxID=60912 RepID=UPI002B4B46F2|nr:LysR family transcriptional regulator [Pseudonocardia sp.]HLU54170.1 LysR family transcriptional regulator [Pseudonocardia sp.]